MKKNGFLILSTSLLLLMLSACVLGSTSTVRSENVAATQADSSLYLGDFQPITGTNYLFAQVSQKPTTAQGLGNLVSSLSSSEDYGSISNLVFLDAKTLSSHKLFDANDKIILSVM
jgi:ABC-type oligopeptide transport system substrate-binding subunit